MPDEPEMYQPTFAQRLAALFPEDVTYSFARGVPTVFLWWPAEGPRDEEIWSPSWYADDGKPTLGDGGEERPCPRCNMCAGGEMDEAPDPCLGWIPGVTNACCGHGGKNAYVALEGGDVLRDSAALLWFSEHDVGPKGVAATELARLRQLLIDKGINPDTP